jgi:hypothetical protein
MNQFQNVIKVNTSLANILKAIPFKMISIDQAVDSILKGVIKNKALISC